jgi:hypothetical protein
MSVPPPQIRYRAVSMELAAYSDGRYVEMRILADTGQSIAVACDIDSIFAIQRHIEQMGRECPEISTWKTVTNDENFDDNDRSSLEAAMSEGGSATSRGAATIATDAP